MGLSGAGRAPASEGFVVLYERTASLVYRRARRLLGDPHAARDVTQDVFLRVLGAFPDPAAEGPSVAWLYRVTTNHCLNLLRDVRRRRGLLGEVPAATSAGPGDLPLALLLRGVPEHLHEVAVYYFVDEMSQEEIATVLGVSQRTVSTRLHEFRVTAASLWRSPPAEVTP